MENRVKEYIRYKHLSVAAFARKCGLVQNTLNNNLNGVRKPTYEMVEKILNANPDLSAEWLTRGKEPMLLSEVTDIDKQAERLNRLVDAIATLQKTINERDATIALLTDKLRSLSKPIA